jgi:hypothetical protein
MHVGDHVHQLAALAGDSSGTVAPAIAQGIDEPVRGLQAERHVQDAGHLALGVEPAGRIGRAPFAQGQGADGVAGGHEFVDGRAASGNILYSPVSGPFSTPEVSGKRMIFTPIIRAIRLIPPCRKARPSRE